MAYKYKNILNMQGDDFAIRTVIHGIQHAEFGCGSIDFNMITPMPPWVSQGPENVRESWCKAHWGVTGNASGLAESVKTYDGGDTVEFDTSGGDVRELMRLLSLCFPAHDLTVDYLWASENVGKDGGMVQFKNGEQTYEYIPEPDSSAAYELAFDIFSTCADDHGLVFDAELGTYRYKGGLIGKDADDDGETKE